MFKNISRSSNWLRRTSANSSPVACSSTAMSVVQRCVVANLQLNKELNRQQLSGIVSAACTSNVNFHRKMSGTMKADQPHGPANRLALEKSPYLRQHAHNPVDWYPWCDEAIQRARDEDKMIFLSIGYSSCHWCHVMEHESFANGDVAKIMNEHFVNIKVDREERPDIDRIYMEFVKMVNDSAGWPMSVWLTPDLSPVMAGTYFPPVDSLRRPSFTKVLLTVADKWSNEREVVMSAGTRLIDTLRRSLNERDDEGEALVQAVQSVSRKMGTAFSIFQRLFDTDAGGFGMHPKFPEVSRLNLIFHNYAVHKDTDALHMALYTLQKIGRGGIRDHIGGGFARYSVDECWHVPHFEKMLYDQGQLMAAYATAFKVTGHQWFLRVADDIFAYVTTYLRHPDGGFYCGEDADSLPSSGADRKVEGAFYAWKADDICTEIEKHAARLPSDIDVETAKRIYKHHYDIQPAGNVGPDSDPHRVLMGQNILIVRQSEEDTCTKFHLSGERLRHLLQTINEMLRCVRDQRPRPQLDIKIITSWNGLMLSGLAQLASCQTDRRAEYLQAAKDLIAFMRQHLFDGSKGILVRSVYGVDTTSATLEPPNCSEVAGFLDDYSFLIRGLLDYYTVSLERSALLWAKELQDKQDTLFWDSTEHGYFFSQANTPHVVMRFKGGHDGAEPGGNSVAARNLILLAHYFDDKAYHERAGQLFEYFANVTPFGYLLPEMLCAQLLYERGLDLITIVGPDTPQTKHLLEICQHFYIPGAVISCANPQQPHNGAGSENVLDKFKMINEKATVYICHNRVCRMPITEPEELRRTLTEDFVHEDLN